MNNISITIQCGYCDKETNLSEDTPEEDSGFGFLNVNFSEGCISFICSHCMNCNIMHLNSNSDINKGRRLPKSTGF